MDAKRQRFPWYFLFSFPQSLIIIDANVPLTWLHLDATVENYFVIFADECMN